MRRVLAFRFLPESGGPLFLFMRYMLIRVRKDGHHCEERQIAESEELPVRQVSQRGGAGREPASASDHAVCAVLARHCPYLSGSGDVRRFRKRGADQPRYHDGRASDGGGGQPAFEAGACLYADQCGKKLYRLCAAWHCAGRDARRRRGGGERLHFRGAQEHRCRDAASDHLAGGCLSRGDVEYRIRRGVCRPRPDRRADVYGVWPSPDRRAGRGVCGRFGRLFRKPFDRYPGSDARRHQHRSRRNRRPRLSCHADREYVFHDGFHLSDHHPRHDCNRPDCGTPARRLSR